jgi:hypothetical protein
MKPLIFVKVNLSVLSNAKDAKWGTEKMIKNFMLAFRVP